MTAAVRDADTPGNDARVVAVSLMRLALALLDRSGDVSFGAVRLQHAIDTVIGGDGRSHGHARRQRCREVDSSTF